MNCYHKFEFIFRTTANTFRLEQLSKHNLTMLYGQLTNKQYHLKVRILIIFMRTNHIGVIFE